VTYEEAKAFAEEHGLTFVECSAKTLNLKFKLQKNPIDFLEAKMWKMLSWKQRDAFIRTSRTEGIGFDILHRKTL
jgi:hypothetical protein